MTEQSLRELLESVRAGRRSIDDAVSRLRAMPFEDLGFAKVDHHRAIRCGSPEVIYCTGKTVEQIAEIFRKRAAAGGNVLATRATPEVFEAISRVHSAAQYHELARTISLRQTAKPAGCAAANTREQSPMAESGHSPAVAGADEVTGGIALVAAGTSDLPVAEEARVTAELMDQRVRTYYDVGVAGIHRLLSHAAALQAANVAIVVAGMEGALPSVVGGLVDCPVIAVPTSVGYGASFHGLAALLGMLNSCASGVTVVNIDNGFGAGYVAALINRRKERKEGLAACH
jgi:NCAIR mutase (PurE)-related protein